VRAARVRRGVVADPARNAVRARRIECLLRERIGAVRVEVVDESALHAGHAGARGGAGHFRATVVSPRFAGLSRVDAQRLVYEALAEMMGGDIHALSLRCESPTAPGDAGGAGGRSAAAPPGGDPKT
jgi:BolA protein